MPESISNNVKLAERGELKLLASCQACGDSEEKTVNTSQMAMPLTATEAI